MSLDYQSRLILLHTLSLTTWSYPSKARHNHKNCLASLGGSALRRFTKPIVCAEVGGCEDVDYHLDERPESSVIFGRSVMFCHPQKGKFSAQSMS
ncbi:hypothetical protein HDV62DRAFT_332397 [Trichoderma sp. SZMC 28011]